MQRQGLLGASHRSAHPWLFLETVLKLHMCQLGGHDKMPRPQGCNAGHLFSPSSGGRHPKSVRPQDRFLLRSHFSASPRALPPCPSPAVSSSSCQAPVLSGKGPTLMTLLDLSPCSNGRISRHSRAAGNRASKHEFCEDTVQSLTGSSATDLKSIFILQSSLHLVQ